MKAYTKLTVVMYCQIFDRKSVAPSSGKFGGDRRCGRPVDKIRKKLLVKRLVDPFRGRGWTSARGVPQGNFNI